MNILVTGFEPFGESPVNPSGMLVKALPEQFSNEVQIAKAILPVDNQSAPVVLLAALQQRQPDAVLCLGLAAGRANIALERVAVNLMDYRIPDNAGRKVQDQPVVPDGPAAYFTTLPVRKMLAALQAAEIPAELSLSAGAYLCNQVFYLLMHTLATRPKNVPAGFVHLPALPKQAAHFQKPVPTLEFTAMQKALDILIQCL